MAKILMPKATAVWLIDNTTLTFEQIAEFCELHPLEVKGIADGEVAENMRGADPVASGELTREEIEKGEKDKTYSLKMPPLKHANVPEVKKKGARFTPVSRRKDRPDAIYWFIKHHPEITDAQISRLIGTTKSTIESVRSRQHWNAQNLKPVDPVTLGLCSQIELDALVSKAAAKRAKDKDEKDAKLSGPTLRKVVTPPPTAPAPATTDEEGATRRDVTAAEVFANFPKTKSDEE
ncbi:MAG TPA: cell cycle transcriptional regulator TrcR [Hyphomonadaceae bacterium]|nr:cell cycle transcriptional regulator TrcR [Hyphomonadaceae bacterium]